MAVNAFLLHMYMYKLGLSAPQFTSSFTSCFYVMHFPAYSINQPEQILAFFVSYVD